MEKICTGCGETKPIDQFYRSKTGRMGRAAKCKICAYHKHGQYIRNYGQQYRQERREYFTEYNRDYHQQPLNRAKHLWRKAKLRHKVGEFTLTVDRIASVLVKGICERTGLAFSFERHERYNYHPLAPSIDKRDPFGGYTDDNVQIVCNFYNFGKQQMTDDEYISFCRAVVAADDMRKAS